MNDRDGGRREFKRDIEKADNSWSDWRALTAARIGLARSGASLATAPLLQMRLAHARARDAVHAAFDEAELHDALGGFGLAMLSVASEIREPADYLLRPDLGRKLAAADATLLCAQASVFDVVFVMTPGLSARALLHAEPMLAEALPLLTHEGWRVAPLVLARFGRVAIGDPIASALNAEIAVVLIGERPGLSAPDSLGAYVTFRPHAQTTDAARNCISNIRPEGLPPAEAAFKLLHLLRAMRVQKISGIALKDTTERLQIS
jgi:ethanolamine ammonia-lyase small subunit